MSREFPDKNVARKREMKKLNSSKHFSFCVNDADSREVGLE